MWLPVCLQLQDPSCDMYHGKRGYEYYEDEDEDVVEETPIVYGAGSANISSRVELFRQDLAPRKLQRIDGYVLLCLCPSSKGLEESSMA